MYSTNVYLLTSSKGYLLTQKQTVVINIGNSPRRYQTVYAKTLKLHKGVDNRLQFQFLNQEQKPVDVTDAVTNPYQITCRILSYDGNTVLIKKALTPIGLNLTGILELQLDASELADIDTQACYYSLEIPSGGFDLPVFVDSDAGARGKITIVDSVLPNFVSSEVIGLNGAETKPSNDTSETFIYHSDVFRTKEAALLTIQTQLTQYTGNIVIEGSTTSTEWYTIDPTYIDSSLEGTQPYSNVSMTYGMYIQGYHPYVRLVFTSEAGTVDNILAR